MRSFIPALLGLLLLLAAPAARAVPPAPASVPADEAELQQAQAAHLAATRRLASLDDELRRKQALHGRLAARIQELKRGAIQEFRLESLQRTARTMADELRTLQQRRGQAAASAEQARVRVEQRLRQRLATLGRTEPSQAEERLRWVRRQEELLAELRRVEPPEAGGPLPAVPRGEVRATDGPEELRELADELSDVGERYLQHAQSLARRIGQILEQRRLARLAQDIAREEGLFDEAMRYRKVGRLAQASPTRPNVSVPPESGAADEPGKQEPGESDGVGRADGDWSSGEMSTPGEGGSDDPGGNDGVIGAGGVSVGTPGTPGVPDITGGPIEIGGEAGGSELQLGLRDDPDASRGLQRGSGPALDLDSQLQLLERERTAARQRAQSLARRAESLRQRAATLERQEGP